MLSNRRIETRRDYEKKQRYTVGDLGRKRSRNESRDDANRRHWTYHPRPALRNSTKVTNAVPNRSQRRFLSKFQPTKTRHRPTKSRYEAHPRSPPLSPDYRVQVVSPQPPHRETKPSRAQRLKEIVVISNTYSYSTEDNVDGRDDYKEDTDGDDSSFVSYYSGEFDGEEASPRVNQRQQHGYTQYRLRIMDAKEANNQFLNESTKLEKKQQRTKDYLVFPSERNTCGQQNQQQRQSWNQSQPSQHPIDDAFSSPLCCALNDCVALGRKKPSLMSLSRRRIPGMTPSEERKLWKEAIQQDLQQNSHRRTYHVEDDPTIDRIEVVPVDESFNAQGGFTYSEREGVGMLFAPQSMPQTPEALPWWKQDGWADLTEESDTVANTTHTTTAYNKSGCGNFCNFGQQSKTLLQQARDDGAARRRHKSPEPRESDNINVTQAGRIEKKRINQLRKGYHSRNWAADREGRRDLQAGIRLDRRKAQFSRMMANSMSNSDLDESLDERVHRIDQLSEAEKRRAFSDIQQFRARDSGGSNESEISLCLDVPQLDHDYKASHFELRAQRYGKPYVVEAIHGNRETKQGSQSSNELSLLPSGSDLSAVVKQKYEDRPRISLRRHRVQPLSKRKDPEVIDLHSIPTADFTMQQLGNMPSGICCHGGMSRKWDSISKAHRGKDERCGGDTTIVPQYKAWGDNVETMEFQRTVKDPKHVIFVDEQFADVNSRDEQNRPFSHFPTSDQNGHNLEVVSDRADRELEKSGMKFSKNPSLRKGEYLTHDSKIQNNHSIPLSPHEQIPSNSFPDYQRRAPSPIKLYGDPPKMRREDGSPVASPRGDRHQYFTDANGLTERSSLHLSNPGDPPEEGQFDDLGEDLRALLSGLSPKGRDKSDGVIIFKPTINVLRSRGKSKFVFEENKEGRSLQHDPEKLPISYDETPEQRHRPLCQDNNPSNILSAEAEYRRTRKVHHSKSQLLQVPRESADVTDKREEEQNYWRGSTKLWYYKSEKRADHCQGADMLYSPNRRSCQPQKDDRRKERQPVSEVIDLSQQDKVSETQKRNAAIDQGSTDLVNAEIQVHMRQLPPESPTHDASSLKLERSTPAQLCLNTDFDFIETDAKPMIPLGLSINDYSASTRQSITQHPESVKEKNGRGHVGQRNPQSKMHVDTDLSWKTLQDLYGLTPTGKSCESLELIFTGRSSDEEDRGLLSVDASQSDAISTFGRGFSLDSASGSLLFSESISSDERTALIGLESFMEDFQPNVCGHPMNSIQNSNDGKAQTQRPARNSGQQSRLSGQKVYAELLRRGKLGLNRSSSIKRKTLEPIHEVPESKGDKPIHTVDKAVEQRNAAVSRLRRLRKLQSKLHPNSDERKTKTSQLQPAKCEMAFTTTKSTPSMSLKGKLESARKKTPKGTNSCSNHVSKETAPITGRKGNSLLEIYVQNPGKTPSTTNLTSQCKPNSPSNRNQASTVPHTSSKTPKGKLISSMPKQAKARSAAAAKPGR